jgi:acetyl-CoA carboxylase biotin carboxyl carrier protein
MGGSAIAGSSAESTVVPAGVTKGDAEGTPSNVVVAPLTGLFYASPSPGAEPYVRIGAPVMVGQVIGLIEAMKLFNEIKSDRAGRVVRIHAEDGALVKAKQPLIEVEP